MKKQEVKNKQQEQNGKKKGPHKKQGGVAREVPERFEAWGLTLWVNPTTQRALDNMNKQLNLYDRKKEKMKKAVLNHSITTS